MHILLSFFLMMLYAYVGFSAWALLKKGNTSSNTRVLLSGNLALGTTKFFVGFLFLSNYMFGFNTLDYLELVLAPSAIIWALAHFYVIGKK